MRLGSRPCKISKDTIAHEIYKEELIYERHRNRYEVNGKYRDDITAAGIIISGVSPDERRVEMIELPRNVHPWFVGAQFHPEFKSRLIKPSPLITAFVNACVS